MEAKEAVLMETKETVRTVRCDDGGWKIENTCAIHNGLQRHHHSVRIAGRLSLTGPRAHSADGLSAMQR